MIELIPAIDIIDGRCVRLTQGDYAQSREYGDPVEMSGPFGVRRLYLGTGTPWKWPCALKKQATEGCTWWILTVHAASMW